MAFNSTIRRKTCKCSEECTKMPSMSFGGWFYAHAPQEIKDAQGLKAKKGHQSKLAKIRLNNLSNKLNGLPEAKNASHAALMMPKRLLLKKADAAFSEYIRGRDCDKNGNVACVCCGKIFNVEQYDNVFHVDDGVVDRKNNDKGNKIINALHFIDRDVYSLRFDEDNAHAGCCYCNLDMHLNRFGLAYTQYYAFMVSTYGQDAVDEMQRAHRKVNKLEIVQLLNVIEHYSK